MKKLFTIFVIVSILFSFCSVTASAIAGTPTEIAPVTETTPQIVQDNPLITPTIIDTDISDSEIILPGTTETYEEYVPFVSISANEYAQSYEGLTDLSYAFTIYSHQEYDYIAVSYATTMNITLDDYADDVIYYTDSDENATLSLDFSAMSIADINLDAHSIDFEKIVFDYYVYLDGKIVQSDSETVYVLPTNYGTYASALGSVYAYSAYVHSLLDAEIITTAEHKKALKRMTEAQEIPESENMTEAELSAYRGSIIDKTYDMKYYDVSNRKVETALNNNWREEKKLSLSQISINTEQIELQNIAAQTSSTNSAASSTTGTNRINEFEDTIVAIDYDIFVDSSNNRVTVSGTVEWSDVYGSFHPARNLEIQIMDEDSIFEDSPSFDDIIITTSTDEYGMFECEFDNELIFENGYDIYVRVNLYNSSFTVNDGGGYFEDGYYFCTETQENVKSSYNPNRSETLTSTSVNASKAIYIHQALVVGYYYYDNMASGNMCFVECVYPCDCTDEKRKLVSHSFKEKESIHIIERDYFSFDTVIHELGHQISRRIGINDNLSEDYSHSMTENLMATYEKSEGAIVAFKEGVASFISLAAQEYYNSDFEISSIPWSADKKWSYITKLQNEPGVKIPTVAVWDYDINSGYGEGSEAAITGLLLDLLYSTEMGFTYQSFWDLIKGCNANTNTNTNTNVNTLSSFIQYLYNEVELDIEKHNAVGAVLEQRNVSMSHDISLMECVFDGDETDRFYAINVSTVDGISNNNDYALQYKASVVIYDEDMNLIYPLSSDANVPYLEIDTTNNYSANKRRVSLSDDIWSKILSRTDSPVFYWGFKTVENGSPKTGPYYSTLKRGIIKNRVVSIVQKNTAYGETLTSGEEKWFSFKPSSSGNYNFYHNGGSDAIIKAYVKGTDGIQPLLYSSEPSNIDVNYMTDSLITLQMSTTATVYICLTYIGETSENVGVICSPYLDISEGLQYTENVNGTEEIWYRANLFDDEKPIAIFALGVDDVYIDLLYSIDAGEYAGNIIDRNYTGNQVEDLKYFGLFERGQQVYIRIRGRTNDTNDSITFGFAYSNYITPGSTQSASLEPNQVKLYSIYNTTSGEDYLCYASNGGSVESDVSVLVADELYTLAQSEEGVACATYDGRPLYAIVSSNASTTISFEFNVLKTKKAVSDVYYNGSIEAGTYDLYTFTAPVAGGYRFFTTGTTDTYIDAFTCPVNSMNAYYGFIDYDDDNGENYNAALTLNLNANETVYIRVMGCDQTISGDYTFCSTYMYRRAEQNVTYVGNIENENQEWFEFTANESGTYLFYTGLDVDTDTYGELYDGYAPYDETAELLASNDDAFNTEDDWFNYNFGIEYTLAAGQTVYLMVGGYESSSLDFYYDFQIEKVG